MAWWTIVMGLWFVGVFGASAWGLVKELWGLWRDREDSET